MKSLTYLILICVFFVSGVYADTLYVHSAKAPVFAEAAFNSQRLTELIKGVKVEALDVQKRWVKIETGDVTGWVPALLVNSDPPLNKVNIIGSETLTLEGEARRRASAVATAGATRGLAEGEQSDNLNFDYLELDEMENIPINPEAVNNFSSSLGSDGQ